MTSNPQTIVETSLDQIVTLMEQKRIKRLPVMRGDKMIGIVSRANLVQALATLARETADTHPSDATLRELVVAAIDKQPWSPGSLINVIVRDGVVELWGTILDGSSRLGRGDVRDGFRSAGSIGRINCQLRLTNFNSLNEVDNATLVKCSQCA